MPTLWMLIGVPGAGKSTWIANQSIDPAPVIISTDNIIEQIAKEQGLTYSEAFKDASLVAARQMNEELKAAVAEKKDIIWDQTNITASIRKKKLSSIPRTYHKIAVYFPTPDATELKKRISSRTGKNIPNSVLYGMINSLEKPSTAEGFNEIIVV